MVDHAGRISRESRAPQESGMTGCGEPGTIRCIDRRRRCPYFAARSFFSQPKRLLVMVVTAPVRDVPSDLASLVDAIVRLPELVDKNPSLVRRGRYLTADFQIVV